MTTTAKVGNAVRVIWPVHATDTDYEYEHAIVATVRNDGSVGLQQEDRAIEVPWYALRALIRVLREGEAKAQEARR